MNRTETEGIKKLLADKDREIDRLRAERDTANELKDMANKMMMKAEARVSREVAKVHDLRRQLGELEGAKRIQVREDDGRTATGAYVVTVEVRKHPVLLIPPSN